MSQDPVKLYAWPTPNGYKISIMLEECGLPYEVIPVNIMKGDQFKDDFLKINPNNKMPAIIDPNGPGGKEITIFESGAILVYLAEKCEKFMDTTAHNRYRILQWLMWQMGGFGPMLGQAHHFRHYAKETVPYAINRYTKESQRLYDVLEKQLSQNEYVAGPNYSIADMAIFPWSLEWEKEGIEKASIPHVLKWQKKLLKRDGVQNGMKLLEKEKSSPKDMSDEQHKKLFGN